MLKYNPPASFVQLAFGYRVLTVKTEYIVELSTLLLRRGVAADISPSGTVRIGARAYVRIRDDLNSDSVISVSEIRGALGFVFRAKQHIPSLVALLLCVALYFFSSDLVFDVRVSGNELLTEKEVTEQLSIAGLKTGDRWSRTDKNSVELALLSTSDSIAWVSINRRGTVAYVEIIERVGKPSDDNESAPKYSNVVADRDCVIEQITVTSGVAVVSVGETVHKGDLLISGIIESERGTEYVRAQGTVTASSSTVLKTDVSRTVSQTELIEGNIAYLSLKIFNFQINILNNYGNLPSGCVIIDAVKEYSISDKRLPVSLISGRYATESVSERSYSDSELTALALSKHRDALMLLLTECDLVSVRTDGSFTDEGYSMQSLVVYSTDVTEEREVFITGTDGGE